MKIEDIYLFKPAYIFDGNSYLETQVRSIVHNEGQDNISISLDSGHLLRVCKGDNMDEVFETNGASVVFCQDKVKELVIEHIAKLEDLIKEEEGSNDE